MMYQEFLNLTNSNVTYEEYSNNIEPKYMRSKLNKQEWCKQYLNQLKYKSDTQVKIYENLDQYLDDEKKEETDIVIVNRGKWIDIDCTMEAKTIYLAFKKLATAIKKYGYGHKGLIHEFKYRDEFLQSLEMYNKCYPYPDETKNGYYGYTYEEIEDGIYYIRYFEPVEA